MDGLSMGILSRFTTYVKSLMSAFLDRAEEPGMALDYSYEKQLEQLENLRRSLVDVVTEEKRLEFQEAQIQAQMLKLDEQARQAVGAGREDLARQAIERKQGLQQYLTTYAQQIEQVKAQQQKFVGMEQRLTTRVEAFRTQKEMVKAQYGAAHAQVQIQEAATGISEEMANVDLAVQRAHDKATQMQARANAMDQLIQSGALQEIGAGSQDVIERQLNAMSDTAAVDAQLAALKVQMQLPASSQQPPLLPAAGNLPATK